jgi:hypothetical protein
MQYVLGGTKDMEAVIELPWTSALLKNQSYNQNDMKKGHTDDCLKAMWDIKMLLTPWGYSFKPEPRIQVAITAYRPRTNIDAQSLEAAISDAIEQGIHINDSNFDISIIGELDPAKPRIVIELSQKGEKDA